MNSKSYRIRTNVSQDQVVRAQLTQDVDFLEILSLRISQEDTYKLQTSNYGIVVGRVLANDAFGIPNAKVSVFVPLQDEDKMRSEITNLYPYSDIRTTDKDNRRYNLLPDSSTDECYRVVGTFPNKTLLLDNGTEIEVYEKYWKYTTVTNKSGDYMLFGVPVGSQQVHVDVDLSDIGVLSQKPRDFIYKGFNITQFDNANQFKESTNLDNLSQLLTQTSVVQVYPFFGDANAGEIAISRCDLQVQYKFEPTCVFFGSIVSDNFSNNIGDKCNPSKYCGFNRNLVTGEGTIEMIRKTQDNLVEEFQIQGNRLIDGNGVWCYQIPMNLDYVGTDEFGNIVPTDNPKKGVPTRTSVRFRVSMQETNNEGISRHRAKYLIPNNVPFVDKPTQTGFTAPEIDGEKYAQCYEFGSATPDEYFRDLYWNKVYSVKNYIPRIQRNKRATNMRYSAIRTVNDSQGKNPFPFNNARFKLFFSYKLLCIIIAILIKVVGAINYVITIWGAIANSLKKLNFKVLGVKVRIGDLLASPFKGIQNMVCGAIKCIGFEGLTESTSDITYYPNCNSSKCMKGKKTNNDPEDMLDTVQQLLAQEYDTVNLDFYNDWVNGCLYLPLWFWRKTKKRKFLFGLFRKRAKNRYCNCDTKQKRFYVVKGCALNYDDKYEMKTKTNQKNAHSLVAWIKPNHGIIKEVENNAGLKIYYYAPGTPINDTYAEENNTPYVVLYATDIILLGSLNECDLDNLPRPFINLPSTTANIPFISTLKEELDDEDSVDEGTSEDNGSVLVTGMDWLGHTNQGLFMDLRCTKVETHPKTCINLYRMSELGVTLDAAYNDVDTTKTDITYTNNKVADGLITRYEIMDNETRAMIASLNHYGLTQKTFNRNTGYDTYKLGYVYPLDFDGHMSSFSYEQTKNLDVITFDAVDTNYVDYRLGKMYWNHKHPHSYTNGNGVMPIYNNSFYFYFGLNEGNTAIDKFNNLFYAECYQNKTFPFTINYTVKPGKWCQSRKKNGNGEYYEYGTIKISLFGIQTPYSYKVYYDYAQNPIFEENNVTITSLTFNQQFTYTNGDKVQILSPTISEDGNIVEDLVDVLVEHTTYRFVITDNVGKTLTQKIHLQPSPIDINVSALPLGNKFLESMKAKDDKELMCSEFASDITIDDIIIDGAPITVKEIAWDELSTTGVSSYQVYGLTQTLTRNNQDSQLLCKLDVEYLGSEELENVNLFDITTCLCGSPIISENGQIHFKAWVPGNYKFTVTQWCFQPSLYWERSNEGVEGVEYVDILGGRHYFITSYNGVETIWFITINTSGELIHEAVTSIPEDATQITTSFRCNVADTETNSTQNWIYFTKKVEEETPYLTDNISVENVLIKNGEPFSVFLNGTPLEFLSNDIGSDDLTLATSVDGDNFYQFNSGKWELYDNKGELIQENVSLWENYVNVTLRESEPSTQSEMNENVNWDLTLDSKANIIALKLDTIFNMCNSLFITDTLNKTLTLSSQGGAQPILYNGIYPDYSLFKPTSYTQTKKFDFILHDNDGSITCLSNTPNIIKGNYCEYVNAQYGQLVNQDIATHTKYKLNPLFLVDNKLGNFFAAFTNDGQGKLKFPNNAEPLSLGSLTSYTASTYDNKSENFFGARFIDKRLDYSVIAKCYGDQEKVEVSGSIYNGLWLRYDKDKNIISPNVLSLSESDSINDQDLTDDDNYNDIYEYTYDKSILNIRKLEYSSSGTKGNFYEATTNLVHKDNLLEQFVDNEYGYKEFTTSGSTSLGYAYISITNCDYPSNVIIDENDEGDIDIKAYVEPSENVELTFQTKNIFRGIVTVTLEQYIALGIWDVSYHYSDSTWSCVGLAFRMMEDAYNNGSHNSFTTMPIIITLPSGKTPSNIINDEFTPSGILTNLTDSKNVSSYTQLKWGNVSGDIAVSEGYAMGEDALPIGDWVDSPSIKYIKNSEGLVYDDEHLENTVFQFVAPNGFSGDTIYLCAMRFYHNAEYDNLMRNICVFHNSPAIRNSYNGNVSQIIDNTITVTCNFDIKESELSTLEVGAAIPKNEISDEIVNECINDLKEKKINDKKELELTFGLKSDVDYNNKEFTVFLRKNGLVYKFKCGTLSYKN